MSAVSQMSSASNNPYARVAYLGGYTLIPSVDIHPRHFLSVKQCKYPLIIEFIQLSLKMLIILILILLAYIHVCVLFLRCYFMN